MYLTNYKYLTLWGVNLNMYMFGFLTLQGIIFEFGKLGGKRLLLWECCHFMFEISFSIQLMIVLIYWLTIYPGLDHSRMTSADQWEDISCHGVMLVFCWVDNVFNLIKPYKRHFFVVFAFLLAYLIVNVSVTIAY